MSSEYPLVSVVVPTYNRAHMIVETLQSAINQSYSAIEIIVVDDNSTDDTEKIVKKIDYPITYIKHNENKGAAISRNTGINAANGEYIAFLDSDDIWHLEKTAKQINFILSSNRKIEVVHCGIEHVDAKSGELISRRIVLDNVKEQIKKSFGAAPITSSLLISKSALLKVNGFDETLPAHQETELIIKLSQKFSFGLVEEFLVKIKRNHDQIMSNTKNYIIAKELLMQKYYDFFENKLSFNLCNIISNYYIRQGNHIKARKFLYKCLKINPFRFKTIISFLLIIISPKTLQHLYKKKYN